jgi:UTP-glucose-1-phosphate uridylyltransferase
MIPAVNKPTIQYAVEEAVQVGIDVGVSCHTLDHLAIVADDSYSSIFACGLLAESTELDGDIMKRVSVTSRSVNRVSQWV